MAEPLRDDTAARSLPEAHPVELAPVAVPLADPDLDRRYKRFQRQIIFTLIGSYGFAYTCRLGLSVVKKPLIDAGIFTAEDLGLIGAAFLYAYGFGKFANGFLADRFSIRWLLAGGLFLSAVANLGMATNTLLWVAVVLWGINGLVQGVGAPACMVSLTRWFSSRERGRYYGLWSTAHAIGEGITFIGTAALVGLLGWKAGFAGPGLLCIGVAIATYFLVVDRPKDKGLPLISEYAGEVPPPERRTLSVGKAQLSIFKMPALWIVGAASACMYVTRFGVNNWGMLYLQEEHGYSMAAAAWLISLNTVAGIAGSAAYGFLSDLWFKARRPPLTLMFGLAELAGLFLIFFGPTGNTWVLSAGFILYGFTLSGLLAVLGGLFAVDIAPKQAAGAVMGFVGVFSYLGAGLQNQVSGHLIQKGTTFLDGVRLYDFGPVVTFWVGASVVSMLLACSLWRIRAVD
jgi:MFS transporter, OPA family, sugar phosphate sensor protein UhpC